jgi:hypothetical protein
MFFLQAGGCEGETAVIIFDVSRPFDYSGGGRNPMVVMVGCCRVVGDGDGCGVLSDGRKGAKVG